MEGTTTLEAGTLIEHRYSIRRFIASGGVAQVYAATHRITGREVALKMPRPDRERDPTVHERLLREGQAAARARHPGVVEIVDAGQHNGAPYLVFELLEGRTLGGLLAARGRFGWAEVAYAGLKIADIVGHCHAQGVVHRDLKPDNLFVLPTGTLSVKLFDFGIAQITGAPGQEVPSKLTQQGSIVGTPEYMAPEALQMDAGQDHRVDVYSLGVILFELLSGSVPFEGRYADVIVRLSTQPLPSLAALRPDVPPALVQVIEGCLAKDPAARLQNMADVARALTATLGSVQNIAIAGMPSHIDVPGPSSEKHTLADTPVAFRATSGAPAASPGAPSPPGRAAGGPPPPPVRLGTPAAGTPAVTAPGAPAAGAQPAQAGVSPATGKRRFARAPYTTPAQLKLASGEVLAGRVEEISEGGVQFIAAKGLASGERGEFSFAEPITGRVLRCMAISRWTKTGRAGRHATGFEFENAPAESRASIKKYVELMGGS
jgi:eukaryotic-like serine/threonine-protein kinase